MIISTTENGVLFEKYDVNADITDSLKQVIDNYEDDLTKDEIESIRKVIKSIYLRSQENID